MCVQYYRFQNPANNNIMQVIQYIEHDYFYLAFFYKLAFLEHKFIKQMKRIPKAAKRAVIVYCF